MKPAIERIELSTQELERLLERARVDPLPEEDYRKLKAAVDTLEYLTELVADKDTTIRHLRQLLLPASTEKTRDVLAKAGAAAANPAADSKPESGQEQTKDEAQPGHGRNGADAFTGAEKVDVPHQCLQHGDRCPECGKGNVYGQKEPKVLVRIVGQAPLAATVYSLERLRCGACGQVFTAEEPEGVGPEKYDETAAAMIAQLKYGSGTPFYRLAQLERHLGIPVPAATQWEIVEEAAEVIKPARDELLRQARTVPSRAPVHGDAQDASVHGGTILLCGRVRRSGAKGIPEMLHPIRGLDRLRRHSPAQAFPREVLYLQRRCTGHGGNRTGGHD
jgi:hypothetical protein